MEYAWRTDLWGKLECPNLLKLYSKRYRVFYDPAYDAKWVHFSTRDPWMMELRGQRGVIYPHGPGRLAAEVNYHGPTATKIRALAGVRCMQDGDNEKTFVFPLALFDTVAALLQLRRRRVLTAEQKQAAARRLEAYHFRAKETKR